jgi:hypothetical protein
MNWYKTTQVQEQIEEEIPQIRSPGAYTTIGHNPPSEDDTCKDYIWYWDENLHVEIIHDYSLLHSEYFPGIRPNTWCGRASECTNQLSIAIYGSGWNKVADMPEEMIEDLRAEFPGMKMQRFYSAKNWYKHSSSAQEMHSLFKNPQIRQFVEKANSILSEVNFTTPIHILRLVNTMGD